MSTGDRTDCGPGQPEGSRPSKARPALAPGSSALEAWVAVLRSLLDETVANEAGVRDGADPERLHDFRVAIRRSRSVLREAKRVLPRPVIEHARRELGWLGRATSRLRDLDVLLLSLPELEATLSADQRGALGPLQGILIELQREAHTALVVDLDSERYAQLLEWWAVFLDHPPSGAHTKAPDAARPARKVAAERIRSAHRALVRDGRRINETSPPPELHELRKDAKKLRYLLECFGSLYPRELVEPVVKKLKGLQDVLGTYQDCQVHLATLEHAVEVLRARQGDREAVLGAVELLEIELGDRAQRARAEFQERFSRFDSTAVRRRVRALGHNPKGSGAGS
ncbi:MAG: CHAD domain-containing protein [Acidimicrobiales bacterium]